MTVLDWRGDWLVPLTSASCPGVTWLVPRSSLGGVAVYELWWLWWWWVLWCLRFFTISARFSQDCKVMCVCVCAVTLYYCVLEVYFYYNLNFHIPTSLIKCLISLVGLNWTLMVRTTSKLKGTTNHLTDSTIQVSTWDQLRRDCCQWFRNAPLSPQLFSKATGSTARFLKMFLL